MKKEDLIIRICEIGIIVITIILLTMSIYEVIK
jgi:hypothetical protein